MRRAFRFLGGLLVILLVALGVNHVITTRETKPAKADIGRIVKLKGGDIQVREDGPRGAPAIVLLHGFDASMHWWTPSVPALARSHRVIRVDLLGHGGSSKPTKGYSMPEQAQLVAELLDRLGVKRAIVAGHSMGTDVAVALTEKRPDLVRGVVVVDESASPDQANLGLTAKLGFYPLIGPAVNRFATDSMIYDAMKAGFAPGFRFPRSFVQDNRRMTYTSYYRSGTLSDEYAAQTPIDLRLAATRKPALVLFGDRDQLVTPAAVRSFRAVRNADVHLIHGAGHSPMFEKPVPTTRLILQFERSLAPPTARPVRRRP
jgi:pimeloyl-ACP methyl ester carboxylesterase